MTQISDTSQKLALSFGLITTFLVLCAIYRKILCYFRPRNHYDYSTGIIENIDREQKSIYVIFFGMMYLISLLNYLTEIIFYAIKN